MGLFIRGIFGIIIAGFAYFIYSKLNEVPPIPVFPDTWWGSAKPTQETGTPKPFKIDVSKQILDDLKHRLDIALPLQTPIDDAKHHYGMNSNLLKTIVDYWKNDYNWTARQIYLNQYPQYTLSVQGLRIHYFHVKPKNVGKDVKVVPLLMVNGFPGSMAEYINLIPLLTQPQPGRKVVFELLAPSLPGFGFSEATSKPGLSSARIAQLFKNLMLKLGFEQFYVQGTNWGNIILPQMSYMYPQNVLGAHMDACFCWSLKCSLSLWIVGTTFPSLLGPEEEISAVTPVVEKVLQDLFLLEMGYMHIQMTKPDTVGVALRESPVGLAAYILEKFITWTNVNNKNLDDGALAQTYTYDRLLDNVMIYWITRSIMTSQRLYAESVNKEFLSLGLEEIPSTVPTACSRFKNNLFNMPESLLKMKFHNLVQRTGFDEGGVWATLEVPHLLAKDVYDLIEKII